VKKGLALYICVLKSEPELSIILFVAGELIRPCLKPAIFAGETIDVAF
jgi:hypothetical protein